MTATAATNEERAQGSAKALARAWGDVRHARTLTRLLATAAVLGALSTYILTLVVAGRAAVPWLPEFPWYTSAPWRPLGEQMTRLLRAGAFDFPGVPFFVFPGQRDKVSVALPMLAAALWAVWIWLPRERRRDARPLGTVAAVLTLSILAYAGVAWGTALFVPGYAFGGYFWLSLAPAVVWDVADAAGGALAAGVLLSGTSRPLPQALDAAARRFGPLFALYLVLLLALRAADTAPMALLALGWTDLHGATRFQDGAAVARVAATALCAFAPAAVVLDDISPWRAVGTSFCGWISRAGVTGAVVLILWTVARTALSLPDRALPPSVAGSAAVLFLALEFQVWALLATAYSCRRLGREAYTVVAPVSDAPAFNARV